MKNYIALWNFFRIYHKAIIHAFKFADKHKLIRGYKYNKWHCLRAKKYGIKIIKNSSDSELEYLNKDKLLELGKIIFLYHDIGRFIETGTELNKIPHGVTSVKILHNVGIINPLITIPILHHSSDDPIIVQNYIKTEKELVDQELNLDKSYTTLSKEDKKYARILTYIIRDVDLLASHKKPFNKIKYFIGTIARNNHSNVSLQFATPNQSVIQALKRHKPANPKDVKNMVDLELLFVSRYFALIFNTSRKIYKERKFHIKIFNSINTKINKTWEMDNIQKDFNQGIEQPI
ncbi:MAG: hypothetical protein LBL75_02565 [Rickettsiales bacterium]|jgi:hypothetical protein|nr:hypothetical protein [Rickettsiales bacterium]